MKNKIPRSIIFRLLQIVIAVFITINYSCAKDNHPNIIVINADDLGYGDLGCYGATKVQTPNIDKLASEGRIFTDAHSASAVCSPSRYGLMTGRYPMRRNFWGPVGSFQELSIDTSYQTLASLLKEAGYSTACIGKWHLGFGQGTTDYNKPLKPGPLELGFDYYFGIPLVNSGPPFVYVENYHAIGYDPNDPFIKKQKSVTQNWPAKGGYMTIGGAKEAHLLYQDEKIGTRLKEKAVEWIQKTHKKDGNKPFFMYLATTNIHHPFTPAPQFKGTSQCGRYGDFIHELDWIVGEVLNTIDKLGQSDNTLIIFTSDNGGMLNHGGQDAWRAGHKLNGELLGFKFGAWEGGHRIPFIAKWAGKIPANSQSNQLISQVDLLSTFAKITGVKLKNPKQYDSVNQLNSLTGNPKEMIRKNLIISPNSPKHLVVRMGNWVYIPARDEGGFQGKEVGSHLLGGAAALPFTGYKNSDINNGKVQADAPPAQLYDLENDFAQTTNVYHQYPQVTRKMNSLLEAYRKKIGSYPKLGWINLKETK